MRYPVAVHHDKNSSYGVTVPDIKGCFSSGNTFDESLENVIEAIHSHLSVLADIGEIAPNSSDIEKYINEKDYESAVWGFVDVDVSAYSGKTEKINVTLPSLVIAQIQEEVKIGKAKNRSAFLTDAALKQLTRN